jgi:hypothetical protein
MAGGDLTPIPPRPAGWKPPSDPTTRFRGPLAPVVAVIRYTIGGNFNGERSDGEGI